MPRPSPAPYRYQDLDCPCCREITLHKQTVPFGRKRHVAYWSDCVYKCQSCGSRRRAKPYWDMAAGQKYAKTKARTSRGGWIKDGSDEMVGDDSLPVQISQSVVEI